MLEAASPLGAWESFYVIVGSSSAALTGLQFVVMTLASEVGSAASSPEIDAFTTPTVVHFCSVLFVAVMITAPWPELSSVALGIGGCGVVGVLYTGVVLRRARRAMRYDPVLEDWLCHVVLPWLAYGALLTASFSLQRWPERSLFGIGASALLLLFVGIHNAWDTVTYIATQRLPEAREQRGEGGATSEAARATAGGGRKRRKR